MGTARGADRKSDVLVGTSNKYLTLTGFVKSDSAAVVYVGQKLIGTIIKHGGRYDAFDLHRRCLGSFRKHTDAVHAIHSGAVS